MKSLNEDLKTGQFKQIYLLYGEEAYLKKLYKNRLGFGGHNACIAFRKVTR